MARRPPKPGVTARLDEHLRQALALEKQGRVADAIALLRRTVQKAPADAPVNHALARLLLITNQGDQALFYAERAAAGAPGNPSALITHAQALETTGSYPEAIERYEEILASNPDHPDALSGKGHALVRLSRPHEADAFLRRAAEVAPERNEFLVNLANHLLDNGHPEEACTLFRQAVERAPNEPQPRALLAYGLNYDPGATPQETFEAHAAFGRLLERKVSLCRSYPNEPEPERALRVGFFSRDLHRHSVAYFLEPILEHHDPERLRMTCYTLGRGVDDVTERLRDKSDVWRACHNMDHVTLMETVRKDRIDVLVDLSGHFAGNRMPVFAARPAPVSVTYMGYPNTTGLTRITARLIDDVTDPAPEADAFATEKLIRIPECFLCYRPFEDSPDPAESTDNERFTFGSFNATKKYSHPTLDAWAEILKRAPESRLLLKQKRLASDNVAEFFMNELTRRGVDGSRVELLGKAIGTDNHLATYHRLDCALDPFPYNGTTTTCEALWMGTPVVTLRGDQHPGRVGASLLHTVGMDELIAGSVEDYIDTAVALATDPERVSRLRTGLRARVAASPLCDGPGFARRFEGALRALWRAWCANPI